MVPDGSLPVFSVDDEKEAKTLVVLTCKKNLLHQFYAPELADDQTLENLADFSDRLAKAHEHLVKMGNCRCK